MDAVDTMTLRVRRDLGPLRALGMLKILHRYHMSGATGIAPAALARQLRAIAGELALTSAVPGSAPAKPRLLADGRESPKKWRPERPPGL